MLGVLTYPLILGFITKKIAGESSSPNYIISLVLLAFVQVQYWYLFNKIGFLSIFPRAILYFIIFFFILKIEFNKLMTVLLIFLGTTLVLEFLINYFQKAMFV